MDIKNIESIFRLKLSIKLARLGSCWNKIWARLCSFRI